MTINFLKGRPRAPCLRGSEASAAGCCAAAATRSGGHRRRGARLWRGANSAHRRREHP
jgi:hypothetical protein